MLALGRVSLSVLHAQRVSARLRTRPRSLLSIVPLSHVVLSAYFSLPEPFPSHHYIALLWIAEIRIEVSMHTSLYSSAIDG